MRRAILVLLALAGCDDMTSQPVQKAYRTAAVGPAETPSGRVAFAASPQAAAADAAGPEAAARALSERLLIRGQEEFRAFCTPCHGERGDGRGMIVQRGFSAPPSYHIDRLVAAPNRHFYDVITDGHGAMYSFAARVRPSDRWAIVAYIRALQDSQHAEVASLDPAERARLP